VVLENISEARFFITFPVGLEALGEEELLLKWPLHFRDSQYRVINRVMGGIEIECERFQGFSLNHILKCPSRILMRLYEFKCRDVPKLFQKTSKFKWAPYLLSQTPKLHIAASESRLFDSRKIEKAFLDGVAECFRHQPMKKKYQELHTKVEFSPEVFIRFENDTCTFSLDTTGELLHKRGEKVSMGHAPLRESLASLLLLALGSNPHTSLIDPMCGSGTFLTEGIDFFKVNNTREFSYQNLPLYFEEKNKLPLPVSINQKFFNKFIGFDLDTKPVHNEIHFALQDVFATNKSSEKNTIVIVNPPYGKRVGDKNEINVNYYLKILESVKNNYSPIKIGIIIPEEYSPRSIKNLKILKKISFKNGGIPVNFYVFQ
jgi:putative N6-adenine-specific DNA methylase